jgi:1,4-dihydroxy-2-naphthoate octaprenyltransferase
MNSKNQWPPRVRPHHIVLSVVAIVVAVALALNYYLW